VEVWVAEGRPSILSHHLSAATDGKLARAGGRGVERRMREVDERHANSCHPQDIPHPAAATDWRSASPACEVLSAEDFS
jgi:hypothetical protein